MKSIDEIVGDKILDLVHFLLSKLIKPDIVLNKINELGVEEINRLKQKYEIEGIIIDVDQTLRKEMMEIPKCNKKWINDIKGKIKIIILSNGKDKKIEEYFKNNGIDYIGFGLKPLKRNFLKACKKMRLSPEKVMVIGDNLFCDIYGGKRVNMTTALVKDVDDIER